MKKLTLTAVCAALALSGAACHGDFLSGGDLSNDPNRPSQATNSQLFVAVQTNTWALYGSDISRLTAMFDQQAQGVGSQYIPIYDYNITEGTTNGQHEAFYSAGGLVDVRKLQEQTRAVADTLFLGIAQIQEALQMSLAADIFGDLVYSQALQGGNPPLDQQAAVYAALIAKLDSGITNVNTDAATNVGPDGADLAYGGDPDLWTQLAHTLKARIYLNQAETNPALYANVLTEAEQGIASPSGNYLANYSGNSGEDNLLYQFTQVQRPGYIAPDPFAGRLLASRNDPRFDEYFSITTSTTGGVVDTTYDFSDTFIDPAEPQIIASYAENELMIAEAAYRTSNIPLAQQALVAERAAAGFGSNGGYTTLPTGANLLREILTEKYIALYMQPQAYNDYKRTCFPNLTPVVAGQKIPARLKYDINERQTNPNIPVATDQPTRNDNDPPNATDPFGNPCLGQ